MEDAKNNVVYAGFWLRFCAMIIDSILFILLLIPLPLIYGFGQYLNSGPLSYLGVWHILLELILPITLTILLWLRFSATPGKMFLKLKIVDTKTSGPISFRQALIRYIGYLPSFYCLLLGILWVAFDKRKQGWHDKLASTAVIRVNK
ncbi:MAG: RDD family protein [Cellvibrionales bacterium]|jgi:uncharacterized RDD family membrane protein YckC|nr:RDD family protein [Cellvibrionales bacterium]